MFTLQGAGLAVADMVKAAVNESKAPFVFTWARKSWKPWDWKLTRVDHPLVRQASAEMLSSF